MYKTYKTHKRDLVEEFKRFESLYGFHVEYIGVYVIYLEDKEVITLNTESEVRSFILGFEFNYITSNASNASNVSNVSNVSDVSDASNLADMKSEK